MGSHLDEPALVHHRHPVGPGRGRQPVGDDDDRPSLHEGGDGPLDLHLGAGVQVGGGLVEDEDGGVGQRGPGQGDELALPGRQAGAPLPDLGGEALGQALEVLEHPDGVHGPAHLLVAGAVAADAHVLEDRAVEEEPLLGDDDDALPQRAEGGVPQVGPAQGDRALGGVVEPGHQLGQGRLPRARRPHQGQALPRRDGEAHVAQDLGAVAIGETDAAHLDGAPDGQVDGAGALLDGGAGVEQPEELGQRRAGGLDQVEELAELLDGVEQVAQVEHEGGDGAQRGAVLVHQHAAEADDGGGGDDRRGLHHREVPGRYPDGADVGVELGVVVLGEAAGLQALAPEGLDDPDAGDALLQGRHGLADAVPHRQVGRVRLAPEPAGGDHQGGQGHQLGTAFLPVATQPAAIPFFPVN